MDNFIRENTPDIAKYLPEFVSNDKDINAALSTESAEHERQRLALIDILQQFFVETATWGLASWEKLFELKPGAGDSYNARRAKILAKLRGKQISTIKFIQNMSAAFFPKNTTITIHEVNEKNLFYLIADDVPDNCKELIDTIEIYKPAHLAVMLQIFFRLYGGLAYGGIVQQADIITIQQEV